jgi:hypothetical protein
MNAETGRAAALGAAANLKHTITRWDLSQLERNISFQFSVILATHVVTIVFLPSGTHNFIALLDKRLAVFLRSFACIWQTTARVRVGFMADFPLALWAVYQHYNHNLSASCSLSNATIWEMRIKNLEAKDTHVFFIPRHFIGDQAGGVYHRNLRSNKLVGKAHGPWHGRFGCNSRRPFMTSPAGGMAAKRSSQ